MAYVSDRQLVEEVLPSHLMLSVVINGAQPDDPEAQATIAKLTEAAEAPLEGLPDAKRRKILLRSQRAYHAGARPYSGEGHIVAKFGLIVFYWLEAMIEDGHYVIPEDSPFMQAMDSILPGLAEWAEIAAMEASAKKQARKFHELLQAEGLFRGITLAKL